MPFDWMKTRVEGVLRYLTKDFEGFFDVVTTQPVPDSLARMVMHRDYYHSFWHDDLNDVHVHEKYRRRIKRFQALDAKIHPILFVRAIACSSELRHTGLLSETLTRNFGTQAHLLLVLDFQVKHTGPFQVEAYPNLLIYFNEASAHSVSGKAPYRNAICTAINWVSDKPSDVQSVKSIGELETMINPSCAITVHGLKAFEDHPPRPVPAVPASQRLLQPVKMQSPSAHPAPLVVSTPQARWNLTPVVHYQTNF